MYNISVLQYTNIFRHVGIHSIFDSCKLVLLCDTIAKRCRNKKGHARKERRLPSVLFFLSSAFTSSEGTNLASKKVLIDGSSMPHLLGQAPVYMAVFQECRLGIVPETSFRNFVIKFSFTLKWCLWTGAWNAAEGNLFLWKGSIFIDKDGTGFWFSWIRLMQV